MRSRWKAWFFQRRFSLSSSTLRRAAVLIASFTTVLLSTIFAEDSTFDMASHLSCETITSLSKKAAYRFDSAMRVHFFNLSLVEMCISAGIGTQYRGPESLI
jgi:hypothetical protein